MLRYEMIDYVEYRPACIAELVDMIYEMRIDQDFDFYIDEADQKKVFSCKKVLFQDRPMAIVGNENNFTVSFHNEWKSCLIGKLEIGLSHLLKGYEGDIYLPVTIAAAKEKPWYAEEWYTADLVQAMKFLGIDVNIRNISVMKEACKSLVMNKESKRKLLVDKARELFLTEERVNFSHDVTLDKTKYSLCNGNMIWDEIQLMQTEVDWISVEKQLPECNQEVIITFENDAGIHVGLATFENGHFMYYAETETESYSEQYHYVTAWMPIPQPHVKKI